MSRINAYVWVTSCIAAAYGGEVQSAFPTPQFDQPDVAREALDPVDALAAQPVLLPPGRRLVNVVGPLSGGAGMLVPDEPQMRFGRHNCGITHRD